MVSARLTGHQKQARWQPLLLAACLLAAQTLLLIHALDHLEKVTADNCDICLIGTSLGHAHSATTQALPATPALSHCLAAPLDHLFLQQATPAPCSRGPPPALRII